MVLMLVATGCDGMLGRPDTAPEANAPGWRVASSDVQSWIGGADRDASVADGGTTDATADRAAYLHANLWSVWWNDRARCAAERVFRRICQQRKTASCTKYQQAVAACDVNEIVYGQVGPEKRTQRLCRRGKYPDVGGCDARKYDFAKLRFWWYGAEWQGDWPTATIKIFERGADWRGGGELIALSNLPGRAEAAMSNTKNHGLGYGCAIQGATSGDAAYRRPFGAFAWIRVPTDRPVDVVAAAATNFGGHAFAGCQRGTPTQSPWISGAPGATLGCVYVQQGFRFRPGKHGYWRFGKIVALDTAAPPREIVDAFARPGVGRDVRKRSTCKL